MRLSLGLLTGLVAIIVALPSAAQAAPPAAPLVVDLKAEGKLPGKQGGTLRMLMSKEKDIRFLSAWGYARLIGWTENYTLKPDIAESIGVEGERKFTIRLRKGHLWSDGAPFTSEDFRYFWEDIANNAELTPAGPPVALLNDGEKPKVSYPDAQTVIYEWSKPNPRFLETLAMAREPYIYRPAHYLRKFHTKYAQAKVIAAAVATAKVSKWAPLHNRLDSMYGNDNPDMPTLQPWVVTTAMPAAKFVFRRNPNFHRVDAQGVQLPYIDTIEVGVTDRDLIPIKTSAGDSDLQALGLNFADMTALKQNEQKGKYRAYPWASGKGAAIALYPNLTCNDPVWRTLNRDVRFRRALSLGINRQEINKSLFFGLALAANNAPVAPSPLSDPRYSSADASFDPKAANALLDAIGLTARNPNGTRKLPDGRPLEIIVESSGETKEEADAVQLVAQHYKALGISLILKSSDRTQMRNRAYSGDAVMTVFTGWDNGIPTPAMNPGELAPVWQTGLAWPKWGQYYETKGAAGEAPDVPAAKQLLALNRQWDQAVPADRSKIWRQMLDIHAQERFIIGVVAGVPQPVAVSMALRNVPAKGRWAWDPGAQFGLYRMDTFWLDR
ncbi:MAG TPA: peptide ABC transporter substrate-binding protein [Alphaproteobacteria bacterium]|nr:peptide ABC transporter substrate-binding protein [Alphaproteobacteria bacterium]